MMISGSRLVILLVAVACLAGFITLATAVRSNGDVVRFDQALATALHQEATPGLVAAMRTVTLFGLQVLWVLLAVTGVALLLQRRWSLLTLLIIVWTGSVVLNTLTKAIFVRPRPVFDMPLLTVMFYSFPSGHAMFAATVYGMYAYLLARQAKRAWLKTVIYLVAAALVALVSFSRMYLGVHYLSDVAAGILLGIAWLMLCILALEIVLNLARAYHRRIEDEP